MRIVDDQGLTKGIIGGKDHRITRRLNPCPLVLAETNIVDKSV